MHRDDADLEAFFDRAAEAATENPPSPERPLYGYPLRRVGVAYALWLLAGFFAGHRHYVGRHGTGLAMMFTFGGLAMWWLVDGFLIPGMVRQFNEDQERRKAEGRPPRRLPLTALPPPEAAAGDPSTADFGTSALHAGPPSMADRAGRGDVDFSRAVLDRLYRYPKRRRAFAYPLWLVSGVFGGHRFYLDRTGTGLAMLCTGGGMGVWWLIDAFLIPRMVRAYNEDQERRKAAGLAPRQLAFMPAKGETLPPRPYWAEERSAQSRLVADACVMVLAGGSLGAFAKGMGQIEPVIAVGSLIAITLLGTRWDALAHLPVLRSFDRWAHRLRLFYYTNDPGPALALLFRQAIAVFMIFHKRVRAEAKLYMQLGISFTIHDPLRRLRHRGGVRPRRPGRFQPGRHDQGRVHDAVRRLRLRRSDRSDPHEAHAPASQRPRDLAAERRRRRVHSDRPLLNVRGRGLAGAPADPPARIGRPRRP